VSGKSKQYIRLIGIGAQAYVTYAQQFSREINLWGGLKFTALNIIFLLVSIGRLELFSLIGLISIMLFRLDIGISRVNIMLFQLGIGISRINFMLFREGLDMWRHEYQGNAN